MIEGFFDEYRWLSNFWSVDIEYEGIIYPSVEHYYVAMKIDDGQLINIGGVDTTFTLQELREYISKIDKPGKVKRFGQKKIKIRTDWDDLKISIMEYGLTKKYSQEPFKTKLIDTGDLVIEEANNWNDKYWGVDAISGDGKNILGKLIMNIRRKLIT